MNATSASEVSKITTDELANSLMLNFAQKSHHSHATTLNTNTLPPTVFLLDCRSSEAFSHLHIRESHHVLLPAILYKRLLRGTLQPKHSLFADETERQLFAQVYSEPRCRLVLIGSDFDSYLQGDKELPPIAALLFKKLKDDGCNVAFLEGKFCRIF